MTEKNLSALALATLAGVPVSSITRFLDGKRGLHPHTAIAILGVTDGLVTFADLAAEMPKRKKPCAKLAGELSPLSIM